MIDRSASVTERHRSSIFGRVTFLSPAVSAPSSHDPLARLGPDAELAVRAAHAAGDLLLQRRRRRVRSIATKSSSTDPVSEADRTAERTIAELIEAERPDDGIVAEEGWQRSSRSGRRWVVDPLDGTVNFLYGFPAWCVSVALFSADDRPLVGVVHDPLRGETWVARRGGGTYLGAERLVVGDPPPLDQALVATGFSYNREFRAAQGKVVAELLPRVRDIRRAGAAALDLAWVATGRVDAYYERGLKPWDWAAGRLIAEEAGAAVIELPGEPAGLVAAHPQLAERLAALVG